MPPMDDVRDDLETIFAADGPLARAVEGYAPRAGQVELARAVDRAMAAGGRLFAEAGTGTGKTFAYLVPVLMSGRRIIISTGTRNLQDQLFERDLPTVTRALGQPMDVAKLKGRANYLCLHRLERSLSEARLPDKATVRDLARVQDWSHGTDTGDIAELVDVPEDSRVWPRVTSTVENCLGTECPLYEDCWVVKARRRAQEADLVVVNHYLLLADLALKEEGFGELLPGVDAVVVDEAHQFPEIASRSFGDNLSARQLAELARDALEEGLKLGLTHRDLDAATDALDKAWRDLHGVLGAPGRRAWRDGDRDRDQALEVLSEALMDLGRALEPALEPALKESDEAATGARSCLQRVAAIVACLDRLQGGGEAASVASSVAWQDVSERGFVLHRTPLETGPLLASRMAASADDSEGTGPAWIFTSATLAVGDDFSHLATRLGTTPDATLRLESPFDFRENAVLYLPEDLPLPSHPDHTEAVVDAAIPLLAASAGRAFMLFTSYRALHRAHELLQDADLPYTFLVQGQAPRDELVRRFREQGEAQVGDEPGAVLLGTASFWEGVDVRGPALSLVVIDKLPFAAPDDPLLQARREAADEAGGNGFMEEQLPQAVIALKQGAGRLIRDPADCGVLMIGDRRLLEKSYGRVFLDSLPPMRRTRDGAAVGRFLQAKLATDAPPAARTGQVRTREA